jgi:hypothetical protein
VNPESGGKKQSKSAADICDKIWRRARINAFAHKLAAADHTKWGAVFFVAELLCVLLSIIAIVGVYLLSSPDSHIAEIFFTSTEDGEKWRKGAALWLTIVSIMLTFTGLFLGILANYFKWDVKAAEHKFLLGSYQYIAQRAREANWPDKPVEETVELLQDLERDFSLLKARGPEPSDSVFERANKLFEKVNGDPVSRTAQSFGAEAARDIAKAESTDHGSRPDDQNLSDRATR